MSPDIWNTFTILILIGVHHLNLLESAHSNPKSHQLCAKLMSGASTSEVAFKSITPGLPGEEKGGSGGRGLVVFAGDYRYELHRNALGPNHLRLMTNDFSGGEVVWSSGQLSVAAAEVTAGGLETLASVYLLTFSKKLRFWEFWDKVQLLAAVTTDYSEYLFRLKDWDDKGGRLLKRHTPPIHPTYSLILEVPEPGQESAVSSGYVIHKDIFHHTGAFILYDFQFSTNFDPQSEGLPIYSNSSPKKEKEAETSTTFFYIEKTNDSSKVALVSQRGSLNSNSSTLNSTTFNLAKQLFNGSSPPLGCKLGDRIYFLDVHLGCVYILSGFPKEGFQKKTPVTLLNRTNVPFEKFFLCDPLFFPKSEKVLKMDALRCNSVFEEGGGEINDQSGKLSRWVIGIIFSGFIILVLVTSYYCSKCCENNKKKAGKRSSWIDRLLKSTLKKEKKKSKTPTLKVKSQTPTTSISPTTLTSTTSIKSPASTTATTKQSSKAPITISPTPKSTSGAFPSLPPLGTPATTPPEGRAPFQERVKAVAQAIAQRAPPPPLFLKVKTEKVKSEAEKGEVGQTSSKAEAKVKDVMSSDM